MLMLLTLFSGLYEKTHRSKRKIESEGSVTPEGARKAKLWPTESAEVVAAAVARHGTCPGDGLCDGTGGTASCNGCPAFYNNVAHIRKHKEKGGGEGVGKVKSPAEGAGDEGSKSISMNLDPSSSMAVGAAEEGSDSSDSPESTNGRPDSSALLGKSGTAGSRKGKGLDVLTPDSLPPLDESVDMDNYQLICSNCGTNTTPLWRRDEGGNNICNACGESKLAVGVRPAQYCLRSLLS